MFMPSLNSPIEEWAMFKSMYDAVDSNLSYKVLSLLPSL
jgi:hypothetical protein